LLASATKLLTTVAILQLTEKGLVGLDSNIETYVPALASLEILTGFDKDDGSPILKKREKPILLRHLLTHSYGQVYDFRGGLTLKYQMWRKRALSWGPTVEDRFDTPLVYEPGEGFGYSPGLDWAGKVLEKITGQTLDEYMKEQMWPQLGIKHITFWPESSEFGSQEKWEMSMRDRKSGRVVPHKGLNPNEGLTECLGGQGAYASMLDFFKVMCSLLIDDEKLLKRETTANMFRPQLSPASKRAIQEDFRDTAWAVGNYPDNKEYDWGLGGVLADGDGHEYRRRGTLMWSGATNVFWVCTHSCLLRCIVLTWRIVD
jgi:CubicO group peptidase (beta-lactamase class C family)